MIFFFKSEEIVKINFRSEHSEHDQHHCLGRTGRKEKPAKADIIGL